MAIDLSQFHQVFFEESLESIDIMESSLMELDINDVDSEVINAIFRAAHSIKGGSATFGFKAISGFTHILETLLDQIRGGERKIEEEDVNLFFQSVDCMREMLQSLQAGEDTDTPLSIELAESFNARLSVASSEVNKGASISSDKNAPNLGSKTDASEPKHDGPARWEIHLKPGEGILKSGNDPIRLIRELGTLGELKVSVDTNSVPSIQSINSENCYLSWLLELISECTKQDIDEIFEWISDESDISILCDGLECDNTEASTLVNDVNNPVVPGDISISQTFWSIEFSPNLDMLVTGNDPVKLFKALEELGEIKSIEVSENLTKFETMNPECCYLYWQILLDAGSHDLNKIEEVFEWVKDECKISITPVSGIFSEKDTGSIVAPDLDVQLASSSRNSKENNLELNKELNEELTEKSSPAQQSDAKPTTKKPATKPNAEASSIRVGIDKIDNLINMVGELVITQSMLGQLGNDFDLDRLPKLLEGLSQLEQNTRELQESVMRIRMLPISFVFSRFPRMVRDLSQSLHKKVNLEIIGDQTELDKTVLEKIGDPLVHLVRNAVDHGIETCAERLAKGKSEQGNVTLNAYHQGGNVVIEVKDDGKGLDVESLKQKALEKGIITVAEAESMSKEHAFDLIFQPGFSTAANISDISGRGVGMDVVKRNIQALNGAIFIKSEVGEGSTITIRLPLTLAILDGQLVRVADQTYIVPIVSIVESLQCHPEFINRVAGGSDVFRLREEYVPIIHLAKAFNIKNSTQQTENSLMVVVETEGEKVGVVVDELLAQQQVVIKSLEHNYQRVQGVSGATILGDGTVALIVDIPGIVRLAGESDHHKSMFGNVTSIHSTRDHQNQVGM